MAEGISSHVRSTILSLLSEHRDTFISGEQLRGKLNISRAAVWKHIDHLRQAGYTIESQKKSGYRLLHKPNTLLASEIQAGLKTKSFGQAIHYAESVLSTQGIAHRLATEGADEGTLVVANEQTGGRGRLGRPWHAPKGTAISASLILRPPISPHEAPQLTLLAAVGVEKGINAAIGLDCDIKWPNDLLSHGRKLVGILTELQAEPDLIHSVILGVGINVNLTENDFPGNLRGKATSLKIETGREINRAALLRHILLETETLYKTYLDEGFHLIKLLWESYSTSLGKTVEARMPSGTIRGQAKGLSPDGFLKIEDEAEKIHYISSADIVLPSEER